MYGLKEMTTEELREAIRKLEQEIRDFGSNYGSWAGCSNRYMEITSMTNRLEGLKEEYYSR